jgi:hypothetical protein
MSFEHVKVGDTVTRMLAASIPMELTVTHVDYDLIHCGDWTFHRKSGTEYDDLIKTYISHLVLTV